MGFVCLVGRLVGLFFVLYLLILVCLQWLGLLDFIILWYSKNIMESLDCPRGKQQSLRNSWNKVWSLLPGNLWCHDCSKSTGKKSWANRACGRFIDQMRWMKMCQTSCTSLQTDTDISTVCGQESCCPVSWVRANWEASVPNIDNSSPLLCQIDFYQNRKAGLLHC